jgi:hypothetical protein
MDLISCANSFQAEGLNPLPLKKDKSPMLPMGHNFFHSPIDFIEQRFKNAQLIGIACGPVSSGFYCIDFDRHQGQNLDPIFYDFFENATIQRFIKHNQLTCAKTPSGGFHAYLRTSVIKKGTVFSRYSDGNTMIEMRGQGQYCAVYPSPNYIKLAGPELEELDSMDESSFEFILEVCKSYDQAHTDAKESSELRKWPEKWDDSNPIGNFNNNQADYAKELLTNAGWKKIALRRDGIETWQRPGKGIDEGISATFGAKFNMFYVFSSNAYPFQANTGYNPFQIYSILEHNGDWKKAKDAISPKVEVKQEPDQVSNKISFPIDVFPAELQEYIKELKSSLNFHEDFSAVAAMFAVSTINGNLYKLKVKNGWNAPTIFWFACVGHPGTIKTHPVRQMINPIFDIDASSKEFYDSEMMHWDPDEKPKKPKPKFRQILISDYTIEALHSIHDFNKRGVGLYKDELIGFLNDMNKYRKGSDEQFWLESINNGNYVVNRVSKEPIMIKNICVNIIGTIQHDVLNKMISTYHGNGLIDRFLFTASEDKVYEISPNEIDDYWPQRFKDLMIKANKNFTYFDSKDEKIIQMTREAFNEYRRLDAQYVEVQRDEATPQHIKNYLSKMKTYVPRFALLLGIMDEIFENKYIEVNERHMINAGRIAEYFINTAMDVFIANDIQMQIRQIADTMRTKTKSEKIFELYQKGFKQADLAKFFGESKQVIYYHLKKSSKEK